MEHVKSASFINYTNPLNLANLMNSIHESLTQEDLHKYVTYGICLDSAHIYINGIDLQTKKMMKDYIKTLSGNLKYFFNTLIHMNDSQNDLGSHIDLHRYIGYKIWKEYEEKQNWQDSGILYLLKWCKKNNIDFIFEINDLKDLPYAFNFMNIMQQKYL